MGRHNDPVIKGKVLRDGKATDLVLAAENREKSGKSSKAALDNFVRKNPASWEAKIGQKTGELSSRPHK